MSAPPTERLPLLEARGLRVDFRLPAAPWAAPRILRAVQGVDLTVQPGQTLGIVGESGCGKSTLARALLNLVTPSGGELRWQGRPLRFDDRAAWQGLRRSAQMIFQDPLACLNPRMTVGEVIAEPLRTHEPILDAAARRARVLRIMDQVGLSARQINRYPHEFSGGQCQRIGIARALVLGPRLLICDEPVSALDVSIQAQIINLLQDLQAEMGLAMVFIAHDLAVVRHVSQQVLVMYLGRVVESADKQLLYRQPAHPYTRALMSAIPLPDPVRERAKKVELLQGELPSPMNPPSGCAFRTRCPQAEPRCASEQPVLRDLAAGQQVSCHLLGP